MGGGTDCTPHDGMAIWGGDPSSNINSPPSHLQRLPRQEQGVANAVVLSR
jgi:hypothetical protein